MVLTRSKIIIVIVVVINIMMMMMMIIIEVTSKYGREGQQGAGSQQMEDQLSFVLNVRVLANGQGFPQVSVINRGQMLEWVLTEFAHDALEQAEGSKMTARKKYLEYLA